MRDMTTGSPVKLVLNFALPMFIASIFQQLYNTVDSVVVGRFVGPNALAAVGSAFPAMFLVLSFIMGLTIGVQIIISQLFGAGDHKRLKVTFATSLISMTVCVLIASVVGSFIAEPLLIAMKTPPEILVDSIAYLDVSFKGIIFMFIYNLYTSMLRGVGDSRTPLYFLIFSSLLNIVLDLLFVISFGMGVRGVAIATVISQGVSAVMCIVYTYYRVPLFRLERADLRFDWDTFKTIIRFGIPSAIQQSIASIGSIFVQSLVNSFGASAVAAFAAGNKVESIFMMPLINISGAMSTYIGQNTGAGKLDRVKTGFKKVTAINVAITAAISIIALTFPSQLLQIFINAKETKVIELGVIYLSSLFIFYFMQALMFSMASFFRGVGDMNVALAMSMVSLFVRIGSAYALAGSVGYLAISISQPIGWTCSLIIAVIAYKSHRWTKFAVVRVRVDENGDPINAEELAETEPRGE